MHHVSMHHVSMYHVVKRKLDFWLFYYLKSRPIDSNITQHSIIKLQYMYIALSNVNFSNMIILKISSAKDDLEFKNCL